MAVRIKSALKPVGIAFALLLAMAVGYVIAGSSRQVPLATVASSQAGVAMKADQSFGTATHGSASGGAPEGIGSQALAPSAQTPLDAAAAKTSTKSPDRLVVSTGSIALEVADLDRSLAHVRAIAAESGSEISELQATAGETAPPNPTAVGAADSRNSVGSPTPSSAQVTLRVPASKLAAVEAASSKLGRVLTQTASETDVGQQHVDLAARLKNLRAEEARLRGFLGKAKNVDDLLSVEAELSRVRGEIESMQAQLDYLERQAAMATLTLSLSEPGAVVRPAGTDWGFSAAVTEGVQAAASIARSFVTVSIALSPVIVLALILWFVWRRLRRRQTARDAAGNDKVAPEPE